MALTRCKECGKEVSDHAPGCPHCGNPFRPAATPAVETRVVAVEKNSHPILTFIGGAVVVVGILAAVGMMRESDETAVAKTPLKPKAPAPAARFVVTDVLMDENCTELGDYCISVHCTFQNSGNAAGMFRVRAKLLEKGSDRVLANRYSDLTLLPAGTQRIDFNFKEAELGWEFSSLCQVDPGAAS
jgi:hypothetical protein